MTRDIHHARYFVIFAALCGFTLLSILTDVVHLDYHVKVVAVLAVATCKALCVMAWFMHLKFERAWKYVLLAPTTSTITRWMFRRFTIISPCPRPLTTARRPSIRTPRAPNKVGAPTRRLRRRRRLFPR